MRGSFNDAPALHLIAAQVLVIETLEPFAEFVAVDVVGEIAGLPRVLQDFVSYKDGAIHAQGERQRVGGTGIDADDVAVPFHPDDGVESIIAQFGDYYLMDGGVETDQDILDEIVGHGARSGDFFDFQGDGVRFVDPDPDGQDGFATNILQNDDRHVADWIHHQAPNLH